MPYTGLRYAVFFCKNIEKKRLRYGIMILILVKFADKYL